MIQSIYYNMPGRCPGKTHGSRGAVPSLTAEKYMKDYRGGLVVDKHEGCRAVDPWPRQTKSFNGTKSISHRSWTTEVLANPRGVPRALPVQ